MKLILTTVFLLFISTSCAFRKPKISPADLKIGSQMGCEVYINDIIKQQPVTDLSALMSLRELLIVTCQNGFLSGVEYGRRVR